MFNFPFQVICPKEKDNSCKEPKNYNGNIPFIFYKISNNSNKGNPFTHVIQIFSGTFSLFLSHNLTG